MDIRFRSCCSSSSGNCLHLQTGDISLLIDCGFRSQRAFEAAMADRPVDAVLVSHAHTDHVNYHALRVLARRGIPLYAEEQVMDQLFTASHAHAWADALKHVSFRRGRPFSVAGVSILPIEVPHAPGFPNCAFQLSHHGRTLVTCTDSSDAAPLLPALTEADFIYLEANHDLKLLRLFPNESSRYHLSNIKSGHALAQCLAKRSRHPQAIMLGHLSTQRNRPDLALATVRQEIARAGAATETPILAAPAYAPSPWLQIACEK